MATSRQQYAIVALFGLAVGAFGINTQGCSSKSQSLFDQDSGGGGAGGDNGGGGGGYVGGGDDASSFGGGGGGGDSGGCVGLQCQVNHSCANGGHTTISGKVYDPAGVDGVAGSAAPGVPLYNVVVYVPTDPAGTLPKITPGTAKSGCNTCDANIGDVVTSATTDAHGAFQLVDVPTGSNIPLVMQVGKWRREIKVPSTADCADTKPDPKQLRLPRNQSEGDIPQMAILTGGCDPLGCLFSRIGLDPKEFTDPTGTGRMKVFQGSGGGGVAGSTPAPDCSGATCPLWQSSGSPGLADYDIVLLSCECAPNDRGPGPDGAFHDWLNGGGKAFATHYHYTWFVSSPDPGFQQIAAWDTSEQYTPQAPFLIDNTFPKGQSFTTWLSDPLVNATNGSTYSVPPAFPVITLNPPDVREDLTTLTPNATRWVWEPPGTDPILGTPTPEQDKYFSFETPLDAGFSDVQAPDGGFERAYCGKAVYSDIHVGGTENAATLPTTCDSATLTPQERALEFLFFDLSACVSNDQAPPPPPPPPK